MQRHILNLHCGLLGNLATRVGAVLAMTGLLLLSGCDSRGLAATEHNLSDPAGADGVPPTLTFVSVRESSKSAKPDGTASLGKIIRIEIVASESIKAPVVTVNGVDADVVRNAAIDVGADTPKTGWVATRVMDEADADGEVFFLITFQDISGEVGVIVTSSTDGSAVLYCAEGCPETGGPVTLAGDWRLDGDGAAGVGPTAGDVSWWASTAEVGAGPVERACWFDDVFRFGENGSFNNIQGDDTWLETWQGVEADGCGAPVAPHDGSTAGTWTYDEDAGTLTITGIGSHLGLAKAVNGQELPSPGDAPDSIVYQVLTFEGDSLVVSVEAGDAVWWTFRLARDPVSPVAGKWKLDGDGAAGVGPVAGDVSWWASTAEVGAGPVERACWFDDVYEFGTDGSFRNIQGADTWLETWQGVGADGCGAPVAPHDGTNPATFSYDEGAGTLVLDGLGAYLGLAKAVNGEELASPGAAPESVTYDVLTLDGDNMTVAVEAGDSVWWTFRLIRVSNSPVIGKWKLAGDGAAGVGPTAGDVSWWASTAEVGAGPVERACWFDDIYHFGSDGTFQNYHGTDTWLETWQGVEADGCGAPVAPHVNDNTGTYSYDEAAGTLMLDGLGSYLGLAKAVNGQELASPGDAPESVTYDVLTLDGDNMSVTVEAGDSVWWTFNLERVTDTAALAGKWSLNGDGAAGVGPVAGDVSWWASTAEVGAGPEERDCWFDDVFNFDADGSFMNDLGSETWLETWQGVTADGCGAPIAPHDGSARAIFEYDDAAGKLTIYGRGAHLGLAKAVNGQELASPGDTPDSVTYDVLTLDGDIMTVTVESGDGVWWTFSLAK